MCHFLEVLLILLINWLLGRTPDQFFDSCSSVLLCAPHGGMGFLVVVNPQQSLLESWGAKWGMRFNAAKCNIMRVSRMRLSFLYSYKLSGQVLDEVKDSKYLGVTVTISDNLDWSKHITTTTTKANARLSFIKRNLKDCPQKLKLMTWGVV